MSYRKKLIEVALPLDAINTESALRKRKAPAGYPTTLHKWWAQRPLAACRAVLFASLVDDPSSNPEQFPTDEDQDEERQRIFRIITELVKWENTNNETVLEAARAEIRRSTGGNPPPVLDPFCGGGSIPLEAQRLGLVAHASDINPVAVLITKALIEIPPKFANRPPVNPEDQRRMTSAQWKGASGLAADVRYYGRWMRDEAARRIGHLYPKVILPQEHGGAEAAVVAWLWARTVKCPNPACGAQMPLVRSFSLSTKKGKEAWSQPIVDRGTGAVHFEVQISPLGTASNQPSNAGSASVGAKGKKAKATFRCLVCASGIAKGDYIDLEANSERMGVMPLAIVAEGARGRVYVSFDIEQSRAAIDNAHELLSSPTIQHHIPIEPARGTFASNAQGRIYGFRTFADYFTPRQLVALTTFGSLISEVQKRVWADCIAARVPGDNLGVNEGGTGAQAYADSVATYLAFAVSRLSDYGSSLASWRPKDSAMRSTLAMQAIQMAWEFAEGNPFGSSSAGFLECTEVVARCLAFVPALPGALVQQADAAQILANEKAIVATDPPYYHNISYADLSDFFFVWLRRSLSDIYPILFDTILTPKIPELVATPFRFGGDRDAARHFFEGGLEQAFKRMYAVQDPAYPLTVYYAFKQSEADPEDDANDTGDDLAIASTGWETMLEALIRAGFSITGTWPLRTEGDNRQVGNRANALASSIVLVCRARPENADVISRRQFLTALKRELPDALRKLQQGNIAPVDLAQSAIGPGMAVFSRYAAVLEADGEPMRVRTALQLINQTLDEVQSEQEGELDQITRWAVAWFSDSGMGEGPYGRAETLAVARNVAINALVEAGIVFARGGIVRLLGRDELPKDWDPRTDPRPSVWKATQHLIKALMDEGGSEDRAAGLLSRLRDDAERARDLAYRLYTIAERKGWAQEAFAYNSLVKAWPSISGRRPDEPQGQMALI